MNPMNPDAPAWEDVMVGNYGVPGRTLVRGEGSRVWDDAGGEYTDLLAGIAVNVLGHAHPAVVRAVREQVGTLGHVSNLYASPPAVALAARLQALSGGHRALLVNSGTEANEAALKAVRRYAHDHGRDGVVLAFDDSFHGRTLGALALTGQPKYHAGFGPLPGGVVHVPFNDPAALEAAFAAHTVLGVFFEAVQGESGVVPMTQETADTLARLCRQHDALLVADEVQAGVGRTGRFFAFEHLGLEPDVITLAKGLGGGMPVGACLLRPHVALAMGPGTHGCTFGGNPVCAAAALAVLDALEEGGLVARAGRLGAVWEAALDEVGLDHRGLGLLQGVPGLDARAVAAAMADAGYLVGVAGPGVVRVAPPLTISEADLVAAAGALARVAGTHAAEAGAATVTTG